MRDLEGTAEPKLSGHRSNARTALAPLFAIFALLFLGVSVNANAGLVLSTQTDATLGGLAFGDDDLVDYDQETDTATLAFDGANFSSAAEDVDAAHRLSNGNFLLSTTGSATLGGLTFEDGDVVEYNPISDTASLFFDEDLFSANEDIDAFHLLATGNLLLSTQGAATLGGLTFEDGDVVEYNPISNTATLFFDEDLFSANEDVNAIHLLATGSLLLSTQGNATLGGLSFGDDDVVEYNPLTGIASLFFDGANFSSGGGEDVFAIAAVPVPAPLGLLAAGLIGLALRRKKLANC